MPNRLIRESLLDSERYWSCTIEARELYRHMQLLADDFGCISLAPVFLGRRCFDSRPTDEKFASLLNQLCDADLVRRYEVNNVPYGFIPRFHQRLKRFTLKHPKPPNSVLHGDQHATELFSTIKDITEIPAALRQLAGGPPAPEEKRREEKRSRREVEVEEKKPKTLNPSASQPALDLARATWEAYRSAFASRWGTEPVRNARVNTHVRGIVAALGTNAPAVAAFFVSHNERFYVAKRHPVGCLLKDAEGLYAQWATGVKATALEAKSAEAVDSVREQVRRVVAKMEGRHE